jgi:hypothetical protein
MPIALHPHTEHIPLPSPQRQYPGSLGLIHGSGNDSATMASAKGGAGETRDPHLAVVREAGDNARTNLLVSTHGAVAECKVSSPNAPGCMTRRSASPGSDGAESALSTRGHSFLTRWLFEEAHALVNFPSARPLRPRTRRRS